MLLAVQELAPALYPFVHSSYSSPSSLFWHDSVLQSAEGVQQGDPLGPLLFCLSIHHLCSQLMSEFNVWHLDDSYVGGTLDDLRHDLKIVQRFGSKLGLHLNHQKSEVVCTKLVAANPTLSAIPGAQVVDPASATLLGSPIRDTASITSVITTTRFTTLPSWAKVAVGLHLGSTLCQPHTCHHCGVQVDGSATQWPQLQME